MGHSHCVKLEAACMSQQSSDSENVFVLHFITPGGGGVRMSEFMGRCLDLRDAAARNICNGYMIKLFVKPTESPSGVVSSIGGQEFSCCKIADCFFHNTSPGQ